MGTTYFVVNVSWDCLVVEVVNVEVVEHTV